MIYTLRPPIDYDIPMTSQILWDMYIMPFLEVTILFNQHFIIEENIVGKFRTGILTLFNLFSPEIPWKIWHGIRTLFI